MSNLYRRLPVLLVQGTHVSMIEVIVEEDELEDKDEVVVFTSELETRQSRISKDKH